MCIFMKSGKGRKNCMATLGFSETGRVFPHVLFEEGQVALETGCLVIFFSHSFSKKNNVPCALLSWGWPLLKAHVLLLQQNCQAGRVTVPRNKKYLCFVHRFR